MNLIAEINEAREKTYGHPKDHFVCTQSMFEAWLKRREQNTTILDDKEKVLRHTIYMLCEKLTRLAQTPVHKDTWDDIEGYSRAGKRGLGI